MDISPHIGSESPPLRSTVLGFGASFLRGRPRAPTQLDNNSHSNNTATTPTHEFSREVSHSQARSPSGGQRRRPGTGGNSGGNNNNANGGTAIQISIPPTTESAPTPSNSLSLSMLRRRRSGGGSANNNGNNSPNTATAPPITTTTMPRPSPSITIPTPQTTNGSGASHRIRLVPHLDSRRTLRFEPICRNLKEGEPPLRIGRFTDRSGMGLAAANALSSNKLAFKSKVVSRAHAEIWVDGSQSGLGGGKFYIKDTKSSSGTFLNHVRLSPANTESRPHQIKDGDILQLGVDYQGGTEDMYKSVKIRIEVGREWQAAANAFNTNALSQLKSLAVSISVDPTATAVVTKKPSRKTSIPDCCICLFSVTIRQALFIAPCSHAFHYKCIRPLLEAHNSAFSCPLCRTFADLDEDVEIEPEVDEEALADEELEDVIRSGALGSAEDTPALGSGNGEGEVPNGLNLPPSLSTRTQRDRSRERDREGAETEVENDGSGAGSRMQRSRTRVHHPTNPMNPVIDLTEPSEADAEMMDADAGPMSDDDYGYDGRSPDFVGSSHARPGASRHGHGADNSEGEGSNGSGGSAEMDGELGGLGSGSGSGVEGDLTVGGKRKR